MKPAVLLSTAYWGPVQYYAKLYAYPEVCVEAWEHYVKQTYRNRCLIASPNGVQALTVPVVKPDHDKCPIKDIRISDHGNWRHLHWNALESAYRNSPFFEYYADDIRPFYTKKWEFLCDFNEAICRTVCELVDLHPEFSRTQAYGQTAGDVPSEDFRMSISPKEDYRSDSAFSPVPYYQVFRDRYGFLLNLSVADLLFNMGPESILVLKDSVKDGSI
ncbi:MAG: WbqC family protein [Paraprevotella sp.]|nr:WbqC family protein [Paraprevotella sp.]MBP3472687.1 WbqC family protein [Paraprevotella sp.]